MSEEPEIPSQNMSAGRVLVFIVLMCAICGFLLAVTSYGLGDAQKAAKEFDQSKQMLIAAGILDHEGKLCSTSVKATTAEIKTLSKNLIRPLVTDSQGNVYTLEEKQIDLEKYLSENKKTGYGKLPLKLFYAILSKDAGSFDLSKVDAFVFPVSGFGLWAPIYGYLALSCDGNHVIGTTWYEHGETPGLGANITEPWWQAQFFNKVIFQESASGQTNFETAPIGLIVVKGKVKDVFGNSPKSLSAVDGMSGATLTGDGVTAAYKSSLTPYRALLIKIGKANGRKETSS